MSLAMLSRLVSDIHRSYSDLSPIHISPRAINPWSRCLRRESNIARLGIILSDREIGTLCKQHYRAIHLSIGTSLPTNLVDRSFFYLRVVVSGHVSRP